MNPENAPYMVQQIIKFSDGTETVINYRGVIKDGEFTPHSPEEAEKAGDKDAPTLMDRVKRAVKRAPKSNK